MNEVEFCFLKAAPVLKKGPLFVFYVFDKEGIAALKKQEVDV